MTIEALQQSGQDFLVANHGSIYLLYPITDVAQEWVDEHLPEDAQRWGQGICIETRYAGDIFQGIVDDGLLLGLD